MKRSELKSIVKECVRDVLFEEGVLSSLIAEIAIGINRAQGQLLEGAQTQQREENVKLKEQADETRRQKLLETKKKMLNAIGSEKMSKIFEGTEPLRNTGSSNVHSPLSGREPQDAGVDISGLFNLAGQKWNQLK